MLLAIGASLEETTGISLEETMMGISLEETTGTLKASLLERIKHEE